MGGLSRKRLKPRIVKKQKLKSVKRIHNTKIEPYLRKFWTEGKSLQENYDRLGLCLRQNPSMKHSQQGKQLRQKILEKAKNEEPEVAEEKAEEVEWMDLSAAKELNKEQQATDEETSQEDKENEEDEDDDDEEMEFDMDE